MRAVVCHAPGPDPVLAIEDVPRPEPAAGEVVVRVQAAGVNFADLLMIAGRYYVQPTPPFVCGSEFAGVIEQIGTGVQGWLPGDRVIGSPPRAGCFAEYLALPAEHLLPAPPGMSREEAAGFIITYGTAWHALRERAGLQPEENLLITGAGGGVGIAATDIGVRIGARVLAAAGSPDKLAVAGAHGAAVTIDYTSGEWRGAVTAGTGGRGCDVLLDNVGGEIFDAALRACAPRARILLVGFASGAIPAIPAGYLLVKNLSVFGVGFGGLYAGSRQVRESVYRGLMGLHEADPFHPPVGTGYPLEQGPEALRLLADRKAAGKIVLLP